MNLWPLLAVGIGGFFGAIGRFLIASSIQKALPTLFPVGTLAVNVLGSFLIGALFVYFEQSLSPHLKALLVTGFLGALTTFSTFSLETYLLFASGAWLKGALNILLNVALSIFATILGIIVAKKIWGV